MLSLSPDYFPGKVWAAHGERLQKRRHCSIWTRCIQVSMFVPLLGLCSSIWTFQISLDCCYSLQIQKKNLLLDWSLTGKVPGRLWLLRWTDNLNFWWMGRNGGLGGWKDSPGRTWAWTCTYWHILLSQGRSLSNPTFWEFIQWIIRGREVIFYIGSLFVLGRGVFFHLQTLIIFECHVCFFDE